VCRGVDQFGYDAANQLIGAVLKNTSTGAILKQHGYTYDPSGNRTSEQVDSAVNSAAHNSLNQITSQWQSYPCQHRK